MSTRFYAAAAKPEYATAKIAVWWDLNDCPIPEGYDARRVRPSLEAAFTKLGYCGPVSITAYGDQKRTPYHLLRGLSSTGVSLVHTISESTCASMYKSMLEWRSRNPPPATMVLVSDLHEKVFSWELSRLQQETQYNLFLAYKFKFRYDSSLCPSAEWLWDSLLAVSETRHVLQKCSSGQEGGESTGMFYCEPCSFEGHRLEDLRKHLWSTKHELGEGKKRSHGTHGGLLDCVSVTRQWARNYPAKPEYATAEIAVWWDMTDCPIPDKCDATRIRPSIEGAFKKLGYSGPVSITAYDDHTQTPDHILRGLSSTGVHVSHRLSVKNCICISRDLEAWQKLNPPPATIMVISNQLDYFSDTLSTRQLKKKYNLCLAYLFRPYQMPPLLTCAEWLWESLVADSETRHVLQKCSSGGGGESCGMFYCKSCNFSDLHMVGFKLHLACENHAESEESILSLNQRRLDLLEQSREEAVLERIRSSEYKRELRLEAENLPKSKRFRAGFRLLDNHYLRRRPGARKSRTCKKESLK